MRNLVKLVIDPGQSFVHCKLSQPLFDVLHHCLKKKKLCFYLQLVVIVFVAYQRSDPVVEHKIIQ